MQRAPSSRVFLAFAALCALAAAGVAIGGFDRVVFLRLNMAARALPEAVPSCLTLLGNGLVAVMLLAPLLLRAPAVVAAGLWAAPLAGLLSAAGKRLAAVPRPAAVLDPASFRVQGQLLAGNNSFPSGHAITIFLLATVLVLGLPGLRARPWAALGVLACAGLAASSRVMVGAHWPSDVLAGALLGMLAGAIGTWAARRWTWWSRPWAGIAFAAITLACACALAQTDTGYPLAVPLQWLAAASGALFSIHALARCLRRTPGEPAS